MSRPRNRTAVAAFVVGVALSGCTNTPAPTTTPAPSTAAPSAPAFTTPAPSTAAPSAPASTTPAPAPTPGPEAWSTADATLPATGAANTGSYLTGIRVAGHPEGNFDRIALDFQNGPELRAYYVPEVFHDASGYKVELDGGAYLHLSFRAAAHDEADQPTLPNRPNSPVSTGLPGLLSYAETGDWEGVLSISLGQATKAGFKVGQIIRSGDTTTIYVDVRRP